MSDTVDSRFAAPVAHVEDIATGSEVLAGRGMRLLAAIIDGVLIAAAVWAVMQIPLVGAALLAAGHAGMWDWNPWSPLLGYAVFLVIQGWLLVNRGQTVGKMLCKMRIVRSDGSKPDAWRLLGLRYGVGMLFGVMAILSMVFSLLDCLLIFRASRKCLHDSIADTQVIKL